MPTWLLFLIALGATLRLTRLVTADRITEAPREWLLHRWGDESLRGYLLSCDYCASMYVAPVVAGVTVAWGDNRVVVAGLLALTASMVAGLVARWE